MQDEYRERFQTARRSALMLRIIDLAFERPVRPIADFVEALGVTYGSAMNNVREPIAQGVAEEMGELSEADPVSGGISGVVWKPANGFTTAPIANGNRMPPYNGNATTWTLMQYA